MVLIKKYCILIFATVIVEFYSYPADFLNFSLKVFLEYSFFFTKSQSDILINVILIEKCVFDKVLKERSVRYIILKKF